MAVVVLFRCVIRELHLIVWALERTQRFQIRRAFARLRAQQVRLVLGGLGSNQALFALELGEGCPLLLELQLPHRCVLVFICYADLRHVIEHALARLEVHRTRLQRAQHLHS